MVSSRMSFLMIATAVVLLASSPSAQAAATITIVNVDGSNEGFNDFTPATPVGGNPGTTIGQQRLNVFQEAADRWGALLDSSIEIRVQASFDPLSCDASSATLGSAGPIEVFADFPNAELPNTWYHVALANKMAGSDQAPLTNDIRARFNRSIDNNANCLDGSNWYYGFDHDEGGDIDLLAVVMHELGHGLGFSTLVNLTTGAEFDGSPDAYERLILDTSTGQRWDQMSNAQRAASAVNDGSVVWDGFATTSMSESILGGQPSLFINSPAGIAGIYPIGSASFGTPVSEPGVTGTIVLVEDGTAPTSDACEDLINAGAIAGNIALIDRGSCTFVSKAEKAEAAGAIAVIIANNVAGSTPPGLGGSDPGLSIPTVSVTQADGDLIKAQLGTGVNATITLDPSVTAGADAQGRVRLYAPTTLATGSSISHWDVSALPNLLMEPAINGDLGATVDLTRYHFEDIGWFPRLTATEIALPSRVSLASNAPNPFNPRTTIRFELTRSGPVALDVFDLAGRHVKTLLGRTMSAGPQSVAWDGTDTSGEPVASGVYVYRLKAESETISRRMVLLK